MTYDLEKLIEFHRYPVETCIYYHGDIQRDTIDALESLNQAEMKVSMIDEALAQLPEEDELAEILDSLTDALDMKKEDMIEQIKKTLLLIEQKQEEMNQRAEHAYDVTKDN